MIPETQNPPAKWILIVSGLFALMEMMVSFSLFFSPGSVLENLDFTAKGVDTIVHMWAVRQFALGFIFAFATLKKSVPMLTISYIFFLVMFAGDLLIGFLQKETSLIMAATLMCVISSTMLYALHKHK
jgi:hypothetical protein